MKEKLIRSHLYRFFKPGKQVKCTIKEEFLDNLDMPLVKELAESLQLKIGDEIDISIDSEGNVIVKKLTNTD